MLNSQMTLFLCCDLFKRFLLPYFNLVVVGMQIVYILCECNFVVDK